MYDCAGFSANKSPIYSNTKNPVFGAAYQGLSPFNFLVTAEKDQTMRFK